MLPTRNPELERVLQQYPTAYRFEPAHLAQRHVGGFSGAQVWKVESSAGPCALRGTRADEVDRHRLAELHRLLAFLRAGGFTQIPAPIAARCGETFVESDAVVWQLEPWMPGRADFSSHPTDARLKAAMTCLARWHLAALRFDSIPPGSAFFYSLPAGTSPGLAERAAQIARWNVRMRQSVRGRLDRMAWPEFAALGHEVLDRFAKLARRVASRLELGVRSHAPLQPCLRDVWHDHLLFTGEEITGLIDPYAARSDCVATDLSRLLGSLMRDDRAGWNAGLAAYQAVRPLTIDEFVLVELFDQTQVLLGGLTWLDWCCLQGRTFADRTQVVARMQTTVARMTHLAESV